MENLNKIQAIILANEDENAHRPWVQACDRYKNELEYRVVNLINADWWEEIHKKCFDVFLTMPGCRSASLKQLYDERIYVLERVAGYRLFPNAEEVWLYENKRFLSFWLKANHLPHPQTYVFYTRQEAIAHIQSAHLPLVAKTSIGASGSGVMILNNEDAAARYINRSFSMLGAARRWGPNLNQGGLLKRAFSYIVHPGTMAGKVMIYRARLNERQRGFVIFQEYVPHEFEWRVVRIGESFFAHKKLKVEEKASGSLLKRYDDPPLALLNFVKDITERFRLHSQAIDLFERSPEQYLINEMQCIFGQSDPFQMQVGGKPGRYVFHSGAWVFEPGDFNGNESFDLRVRYAIQSTVQAR